MVGVMFRVKHSRLMIERLPLFVDWLGASLSLSLTEVRPISGCSIVEQTPTNIWNRRAIIVNEVGDKMLTVLWNPKSSIIKGSSALLEVANEWFYHGRGALSLVREFCEVNGALVTGVSRVDLAVDFVMTPERRTVIWGLADGSLYVGGKRCGSQFWSVSADSRLHPDLVGVRVPHCLSWGHKTSAVRWKLYYKWKELCEAAGGIGYDKPYIVDHWKAIGLDPASMWRLEVSLHHTNGLRRDGVPVSLEVIDKQAVDLFRALYAQRFVVRRAQGHVDRSNDEVVPFLPVASALRSVRCFSPVSEHGRSSVTPLLRNLIKSLDELPIMMDESIRESVFWHIEYIVKMRGLYTYASAVVGESLWDWIERKRVEVYSLVEPNAL